MNFLIEPVMPVTMDPFASGGAAQCDLTCSLTCNLDGNCSNLNCGLVLKPPPKDASETE